MKTMSEPLRRLLFKESVSYDELLAWWKWLVNKFTKQMLINRV